jgi:heparanase 1
MARVVKMNRKTWFTSLPGVTLIALGWPLNAFAQTSVAISPAKMPTVATVEERFQSFNIEMVEVTGGRFWAPYKKQGSAEQDVPASGKNSAPAGMDPSAFRYREPINPC